MKVTGIISTAALSLLLGIGAPAFAQNDQKDEKQDHPNQQESKHEQAKPEKHAQQQRQSEEKQQHAQQQERQDQNKQREHAQQQQRQDQNKQDHAQRQRGNEEVRHTPEEQRVQRSAWQEHRARSWESEHRSWQQRGGYHGYRIPDQQFRGYFGPDHGFRIYGRPFLVVGGFPRFQYSGYWFSLVDPWPEYWAEDWYDTDDVYVTYVDNGYYLFNRRHPSVGIAISISM
jgi:hypothetical protein